MSTLRQTAEQRNNQDHQISSFIGTDEKTGKNDPGFFKEMLLSSCALEH